MKYKDFYKELLSEGKDCVMAEVPPTEQTGEESTPVLLKIYSLIEEIPDDILYSPDEDHGKEKWPHITLLYGLEDGLQKEAEEIVKKYKGKIKATLGKVSKFENENFDVLKIEVSGEILNKINSELKKLPNTNSYPDYKGHVTLAYVNKGEGEDFVGRDDFDGVEIEIDKIIYSDDQRNHTRILEEYFVGTGGGYGGAAGGSIAASGWAATFNGVKQYPSKFARTSGTYGAQSSPMSGNTILNTSPYNTISDEDLIEPNIDRDELFLGIRTELRNSDYIDKDTAKEIAMRNIKSDPKYYSQLKHLTSENMTKKEEQLAQVSNIIKQLQEQRNKSSSAVNHVANEIVQNAISEKKSGRSIESITTIMRDMMKGKQQ